VSRLDEAQDFFLSDGVEDEIGGVVSYASS
jgi:hypothetical protein